MAQQCRYLQICFITYPESMGDIYEKVQSLGLCLVRSPLHDKDIDEDGVFKKPHYHNMLMFSGMKSEKQIKEICAILGVNHYEIPIDKRGMLRYFCHLDCTYDEQKYIYPVDEVKTFGGFDYNSVLTTKDGKPSTSAPIFKLCREKGDFPNFRAFVDCVAVNLPNLIDQVIAQAYFWNLYVRPRDQN
jgi:hypothetical protein